MNKIVNKLLLVGAKSLPEMYLKRPSFNYFASGPFIKDKKRILKFIRTANTDYLYKNDLDKACFQHDMVYVKYKDLVKRTESKKVLRGKAFQIASNPTYNDYQRGLASIVYKFLIKNLQVVVSLHFQINLLLDLCQISYNLQMNFINQLLKNFKKEEVYSSFKDNIWGVYLADMQLISKCNKGIRCLLGMY